MPDVMLFPLGRQFHLQNCCQRAIRYRGELSYVTCHALMSRVTQGEEMADWGLGICCGPLVVCQTAAEHEERGNPRQ